MKGWLSAMMLLLSSGPVWAGDFTVNPNGTVTDNATGLIWQQEDDNTTRNWETAIVYCENLTLATHADWRLPNMKELESITDDSRINPSIDTVAFPNTDAADYWSSTTEGVFGVCVGNCALRVSFSSGSISARSKNDNIYVRCVRGGQSANYIMHGTEGPISYP